MNADWARRTGDADRNENIVLALVDPQFSLTPCFSAGFVGIRSPPTQGIFDRELARALKRGVNEMHLAPVSCRDMKGEALG